jgi:hypothetical protein
MITKELTERTVVRPPEDGIKDHPSLPIEVAFGLQQSRCQTFPRTSYEPGPLPPASSTSAPNLINTMMPWSVSKKSNERADPQLVVLVPLEIPDRLAEQTCTDEEDQVGHDDEEDGQSCLRK